MSLYDASEETGAPAAPSATRQLLYPKSTGWYKKNSAGTETKLVDASDLAAITLNDLADVESIAPQQGNHIIWNSVTSKWEATSYSGGSISTASTLFLTSDISTAGNSTLATGPSMAAETSDSVIVDFDIAGGLGLLDRYSTGPLGLNAIPAGIWAFNTYAAVSSSTGISNLAYRVNKRDTMEGMTGTFTGAGATRNFTVTGGAPFVAGDATASILTASLIETPNQIAWISGFTSSSVVTVTLTDPAYVNESGVALSALYYLLFNKTGTELAVGTEYYVDETTQPAFTGFHVSDGIIIAYFGQTDSTSPKTITLYHEGSTRASHLHPTFGVLTAGDITATPSGTLAGTTVEAQLVELDTEKAPTASPTITGTVAGTGATWNLGAVNVTTLTGTLVQTVTASGPAEHKVIASDGTSAAYSQYTNTGGSYYIGVENSTGASFGATAYALFRYAPTGRVIQDIVNAVPITTVSSTGLAVTGALSASGAITAAGTGGTLAATLSVNANTTGQPAYIMAAGTDTNVGIDFNTKGSGIIRDNIGGATVVTTSSTGLAVTGAISASDNISLPVAGDKAFIAPGSAASGYFGSTSTQTQIAYNRVVSTGAIPDATQSAAFIQVNGGSGASSIALFVAPTVNTGPSSVASFTSTGLAVTGAVSPSAHNTYDLGTTGVRWKDLWLQSGAFNGSDARLKTAVSQFSTDEINAAKQLSKEIGHYQWLESVAAKGADKARHHIGMTVQRAIEVLTQNNLNPFYYAFIGYDKWEDKFVEHPEIVEVCAKAAVLDGDGNVLEAAIEAVEGKAAWTEQTVFAGDAYSFRYDQLNLFIARGFEARIAALEAAL